MSGKPHQILLTGGTGSFGRAFVRRFLEREPSCTIRVYSRDELKQYEMAREYEGESRLRFFIGDVRDRERLFRAMHGVDTVVHAAAMKQVPICEYNPAEAVKTNVNGAQNIIDCSIDAGVSKVIAISTDKAVNPVNLYGATKLCAEKLFVHGNVYSGPRDTHFSVVRYGNVVGSRGSVIPLFLRQAETGTVTVTDRRMTRFWLSLSAAVDFVQWCMGEAEGGEIFVPKIPSMRITDLALALAPDAIVKEIGIRPGEKLHEVLLTAEEASRAFEFPTHYIAKAHGKVPDGGKRLPDGFVYSSDTNTQWLSVDHLDDLCRDVQRGGQS